MKRKATAWQRRQRSLRDRARRSIQSSLAAEGRDRQIQAEREIRERGKANPDTAAPIVAEAIERTAAGKEGRHWVGIGSQARRRIAPLATPKRRP